MFFVVVIYAKTAMIERRLKEEERCAEAIQRNIQKRRRQEASSQLVSERVPPLMNDKKYNHEK